MNGTSLLADDRLAGKTALVTGATSGIGEAIARVLAASGVSVAVSGRDTGRAQRVVQDITAAGGSAVAVTADLAAEPAAVRAFAARATQALGGRLDILVNNAGVYPGMLTPTVTDEEMQDLWATNVRAPHVLVAALVPAMAERGEGVVVNIGSWMARVGVPFKALYPATKAAVEQLTRAWAAEFGPRGVRVNTVAPGATATPGNADSADVLAAMTVGTPAGRPVRPSTSRMRCAGSPATRRRSCTARRSMWTAASPQPAFAEASDGRRPYAERSCQLLEHGAGARA